jgi:hypothetical protein
MLYNELSRMIYNVHIYPGYIVQGMIYNVLSRMIYNVQDDIQCTYISRIQCPEVIQCYIYQEQASFIYGEVYESLCGSFFCAMRGIVNV